MALTCFCNEIIVLCLSHCSKTFHFYIFCNDLGEDDSDLYLEEREESLKTAQEEKRKVQLSVPGILNPHEIAEEMQD